MTEQGGCGLAFIDHCMTRVKAKAYRLSSSKPVYRFQHLLYAKCCKVCEQELMQWRGEYQEGDKFTGWIDIPPSDFRAWKRRIKAGEAKPEAQLTSEWAERVARPADIALHYLERIEAAQRYCFPR